MHVLRLLEIGQKPYRLHVGAAVGQLSDNLALSSAVMIRATLKAG